MATLEVFVAHNGLKLAVDSSRLSSLDEFRKWISLKTSIPQSNIVVLTSQGRSAKVQSLTTETELFVYDTRVSSSKITELSPYISQIPSPPTLELTEPPNYLNDPKSITAWKELYRKRHSWALQTMSTCEKLDVYCLERFSEIDVILRCIDVALMNLEISFKPLQTRHDDLKAWTQESIKENEMLARDWEKHLELARSIPTHPLMVQFMTGKDIPSHQKTTLEDLLDPETCRRSCKRAPTALKSLQGYMETVDRDAANMSDNFTQLGETFTQLLSRSIMTRSEDSQQILSDMQTLFQKIDTDNQMATQYSETPRDLAQASRTAHTHTEKLLPTLAQRASEMCNLAVYVTECRNATAGESGIFMRNITESVKLLQRFKTSMAELSKTEEAMATFDYLRLIHQLPYMYASFMAEAIRRREWRDKMRSDSTNLVNTMAMFQDEETKRRRKWAKMVGNTYRHDKFDSPAMGMEVNLMGDAEEWPEMTKQDLEDFNILLQEHGGNVEIVNDIKKLIEDLNLPTRQQTKRIKAFKNGSLHDNGTSMVGSTSFLIQGDDDLVRSLQEDKAKLESKVMTAESRIKRLEDLLHRQSQIRQQPFSANNSLDFSRRPQSRPMSTHDGIDSSNIVQLEQLRKDLAAERDQNKGHVKTIQDFESENQKLKTTIEETTSTKNDLLNNLESLEKEYSAERKSLIEQIKSLREKLEETEDDIEHFGMSRDNEKALYDERLHSLEEELKTERKDRHDEKLKYDGQVEYLRNETRLQRETIDIMQRQIQNLQEENKSMAKKLSMAQAASESQNRALHDLHRELMPGSKIPDDRCELVEDMISTAVELVGKFKTIENDISVLHSELDQTQASNKELKASVVESSTKVSEMESLSSQLREALAEEKARSEATETELEQSRKQISELRIKISDGETGSESLRKKLEDDEKTVSSLKEELARRQSQVGSLEEEIRTVKEKHASALAKYNALDSLFQVRTEKAKDLTKRIYTQNDRLVRLLERLGFIVTREGVRMTIQRIPRAERSTVQLIQSTENSESPSLARQGSSALTNKSGLEGEDLEQIYWMNNNNNPDTEAEKYLAFINSIGGFDMETFTETVYRRLKDVEHVARKFQRDARMFRDKAHSSSKEAHEKIAFKNFKEGDLALFLPTRNQKSGAWAAFNVGFPHYFLREQESHRLKNRDWLVARISHIQERVVDLSKNLQNGPSDSDSVMDDENDNPFQLSDGLRWYLIDAIEDKPGAPSTPGLGKSTVASNRVSAVADMSTIAGKSIKDKRRLVASGIEGVSKTLSKSLESRRSSNSSRKALPFVGSSIAHQALKGTAVGSETNSIRAGVTPPGISSPLAATAQSADDVEESDNSNNRVTSANEAIDSLLGGG